ncbi:MAG: hypothetical protein AAGA30_13255 [Planctomycetota bacterium]
MSRLVVELDLMHRDLDSIERAVNELSVRTTKIEASELEVDLQKIDRLSQSLLALRNFVVTLNNSDKSKNLSDALEQVHLMDMRNRLATGKQAVESPNNGSLTLF